jgi:hypothetical protein
MIHILDIIFPETQRGGYHVLTNGLGFNLNFHFLLIIIKAMEKRRFERVKSLNLVRFVHYSQNLIPDFEGYARTLDISKTGIRLESKYEFPEDSFLDLDIAINDVILSLKGRIVNVLKYGDLFHYGIEFENIDEESQKLIEDALKLENKKD